MISNGIKDVGHLICDYKSLQISYMKPVLYFCRVKTLCDSSKVMNTRLLQKSYGRCYSRLKKFSELLDL